MSYLHLTITEQIKIATYLELGLTPSQIARKLGVHRSTISRELKRCQSSYSADLATISDKALGKALDDINHRPRKCLAYRTALEALLNEVN